MTNYVWVTAEKAMIHKYEMAPDEVSFLRNLHRHLFKFKVFIEVRHNDRDIEFFMFKRFIESVLYIMKTDVGNYSCEHMADHINKCITKKYNGRKTKIEVSEDNENGIIKSYDNE